MCRSRVNLMSDAHDGIGAVKSVVKAHVSGEGVRRSMGREAVVRERKRASARTWTFCVAWTGDD